MHWLPVFFLSYTFLERFFLGQNNSCYKPYHISLNFFTDVIFFFLSLLRIFISLNIFSFPEVEFFHKEAIQEMMLDLLFCFCKTYPELSYKQVLWLLLPVMRWFLEWLLVSVFPPSMNWGIGWGWGSLKNTNN